jgi:type IV secretion system protein VirD4
VLMMLDEFTSLGRIPIIAEAISYLPGYGVRTVLVVQALAQLKEVYGEHNAETMMASLAARIVYAPKDLKDAKDISDLLGSVTVKARSISRPRFGFKSRSEAGSVSVSEQRRALRLPQEIRALGNERQLIFLEGLHPILCQKIRYYADPHFRSRLRPPITQPCIALPRTVVSPASPCNPSGAANAPAAAEALFDQPVVANRLPEFPIEGPEDGQWSDGQLQEAVETFLKHFPTR